MYLQSHKIGRPVTFLQTQSHIMHFGITPICAYLAAIS